EVRVQRAARPGHAAGIRRSFVSISGVAAQLTGAQILRLAGRPWILAITPDVQLSSSAANPLTSIPPSIEGTPQAGQILTASAGSWIEPIGDYTYQWLRC